MPLKLFRKKNYLMMIENGAKGRNIMFKNMFAEIDGEEKDILINGNLSCALFVTSILYLNHMIDITHATVEGTVKDLFSSGWVEISEPKKGAILVWEKKITEDGDGLEHMHIGFYMGDERAVSNVSSKGYPNEHHYTYEGTRKIEKILWYPRLDEDQPS